MAFTIKLPEEPVDGFVVQWFGIWTVTLSVKAVRCVYHVNTPWSEYSPEKAGGRDLIDTWMFSEDGHCRGRYQGWHGLLILANEPLLFETREGALTHLISRSETDLERLKEQVVQKTETVAELRASLENLGSEGPE